jgi:iron complex transport system substrate-binding protein
MEDDQMSKRSRRGLLALCAGIGLFATACSSASNVSSGSATLSTGSFPTSISAANGTVHIKARPHAIVSLSPTATEMLYSIGARKQVKAVDKDSDYPKGAPRTSLDGFRPNVEAIVAYRPDLVVLSDDSAGLTSRLHGFGIPVLSLPPATGLSDVYKEFGELGAATGHVSAAAGEGAQVRSHLAQIVRAAPKSTPGQTYYYELDQTYFSVTSSTFIGKVLGLLGLRNIADAAPSAATSGGYPQLSSEFVVQSNPDWVFLADTLCCGQSAHTVEARPGWSTVKAVEKGQVVGLSDDIASRWGPRIVTLLQTVESALASHRGRT